NRLATDTATTGPMPTLNGPVRATMATLQARWKNPEHVDTLPANASPLRRALALRAGQLREGAVDELTLAWGADLNHLSPGQIAGGVVRRLADPANGRYLNTPPPPSNHE